MKESDLEVYAGYEIPKKTSRQARVVLDKLREKRMVVFDHDDGLSFLVRLELVRIANDIGLDLFEENYRIILIDVEDDPDFKMTHADLEWTDKEVERLTA